MKRKQLALIDLSNTEIRTTVRGMVFTGTLETHSHFINTVASDRHINEEYIFKNGEIWFNQKYIPRFL